MDIKKALKLRAAINAIISLTDPDRYCVAIAERFQATTTSPTDYEVHLYTRDKNKSGLIDLTLLAKAIECMGTKFLTVDSTYDAGTEKGNDIRNSIKIW